jgi:hypothetical protein
MFLTFSGMFRQVMVGVFVSGVGLPSENGVSFVLGRCVFHKIGDERGLINRSLHTTVILMIYMVSFGV